MCDLSPRMETPFSILMGSCPAAAISVVLVLIVTVCHEWPARPHARPRSRRRPQHLRGVLGKLGLQGGGEAPVVTVTPREPPVFLTDAYLTYPYSALYFTEHFDFSDINRICITVPI